MRIAFRATRDNDDEEKGKSSAPFVTIMNANASELRVACDFETFHTFHIWKFHHVIRRRQSSGIWQQEDDENEKESESRASLIY